MKPDSLSNFPLKRLHPLDGLSITGQLWDEAHQFHREQARYHAWLAHGTGILAGLEVLASDPPDTALYILPGVAIDPLGNLIVLPQPVTYDLGRVEGVLYVLATFGESRPRPPADHKVDDNLLYIHAEFAIEARPTLPNTPYVEIARVYRQTRDSVLRDPRDPAHPVADEIDRRFRHEIGPLSRPVVRVGVVERGRTAHGSGVSEMARAVRQSGAYLMWADTALDLKRDLNTYTLLYLTSDVPVSFSVAELKSLTDFYHNGGTLVFDVCRCAGASGTLEIWDGVLKQLNLTLAPITREHPLLNEPFLFATPPTGFHSGEAALLHVADGVFLTQADYACLWRGEQFSTPPTRETIRTAMEWGLNLVTWAYVRQARQLR